MAHLSHFQHVAITGASSGLGEGLALEYAMPGRVLSLAGRDLARLARVRQACEARGALVDTVVADVRDANAMERWLTGRDAARPIDLVIAAAGVGGSAVVTDGAPESGALAREVVGVNTIGLINTISPLSKAMMARRRGALVLVGSISGDIGLPQSPAYCASKAAVRIYGDALRRLLRPHGVHVMTVVPGFIDTPMSRSLDLGRPFCWPVEKAARRIADDIAHNRRRCVFPWQLQLAIGLQSVLPLALTDFILTRSARRAAAPAP
jgi:short-subunit dehydrogenase